MAAAGHQRSNLCASGLHVGVRGLLPRGTQDRERRELAAEGGFQELRGSKCWDDCMWDDVRGDFTIRPCVPIIEIN